MQTLTTDQKVAIVRRGGLDPNRVNVDDFSYDAQTRTLRCRYLTAWPPTRRDCRPIEAEVTVVLPEDA